MERPVTLTIHPSRFPERTRAAYLESFRTRRMNHQFHYESEKQAQQWLALHEAYSPARTDQDCLQTYERAFKDAATLINSDELSVISIGCGGGQKDRAFLKATPRAKITYIPADVSAPLAVTAHLRATTELQSDSKPLVLDLPAAPDLSQFLDDFVPKTAKRVFLFFGMLPNFEPADALQTLASALRPNDTLLLSANLAPGNDYAAGVKKILPLYANDLTRRWLATSLLDAGLELSPNEIEFNIVEAAGLLRVEATHRFSKPQRIRIDQEEFNYEAGEQFRLFFSYRHTPDRLRDLLAPYKIDIRRQWITASREEGVFLCEKRS